MRSDRRFLALWAAIAAGAGAGCGPLVQDNGRADGGAAIDGPAAVDGPVAVDAPIDARVDRDAGPPPDGDAGGPLVCGALRATVRDFRRTHPDFESFTADGVFPGLVEATLGADVTPTYALPGPTIHTSGPQAFAQWYHDVDGVNVALPVVITLTEVTHGRFVYDDADFFPIDGLGFGNDGFDHNFHFTTEIHASFTYRGHEIFTFRGDDDVWVFINHKLAIDLGGLHQPAQGTVDLDAQAATLGLVAGQLYPMEIFQAERHTTLSNFRIETTIDCFIDPP